VANAVSDDLGLGMGDHAPHAAFARWPARFRILQQEIDDGAELLFHMPSRQHAGRRAAGQGLAAFVVPSYGEARTLSQGLGRRCRE
jgi:hypothetical protein